MLLRLSKRDPRLQRVDPRLPCLLLLTLFAACGGTHFTASPVGSDAGSAGASAGDSANPGGDSNGNAGDGGADAMGASGGLPSAGGAGKGADGCASCTTGEYCQDVVNKCRSCTDFSRLEFATPQPLSTLSHTSTSSERFPRSANTGSALFYALAGPDSRELWYTAAPTSGIGSAVSEAGNDSGPLLLAPAFEDKNFFFDREKAVKGLRKVMMATWSAGALSEVSDAPSPINGDDASDYSFAAAPSTGHAYWMSTRSGAPQLIWESINETPMADPSELPLKIRIGGNSKCDRLGDDATPWVNLNGSLLLFSAESMDDTCEPNDSNAHDLFAVPLAKDGVPASAAIPLSALNSTGDGSDETDPSLAPDSCSIYFASDKGSGNYDLYRAARN
ncbi:MAG: hypothetical protein ABW061_14505 [Polyangiaceae bacterium]